MRLLEGETKVRLGMYDKGFVEAYVMDFEPSLYIHSGCIESTRTVIGIIVKVDRISAWASIDKDPTFQEVIASYFSNFLIPIVSKLNRQ